VIIAPIEHEMPPPDNDAVELLIKEARRKARRRRLSIATSVTLAFILLFGLISTVLRGPGTRTTPTGRAKNHQIAVTTSLPRSSQIWTLDMLNGASGFAVAGVSSAKHHERLIKTGNAGHSWSVISTLPYSFVAGEFKPLLNFVTPTVGYTQAFSTDAHSIFVTTDGGMRWSKLRISGQVPTEIDAAADASTSPDFRVSNGVVSLVSLGCTVATSNGACPATLSEYRWGATSPFSSHRVRYLGPGSKSSSASTYLLAAPTEKSALVAEGATPGGPYSLVLTSNAGVTWSRVSNPCKTYPGAPGMSISGATLTPSKWMLNCSQGTGMNHATVQLSETENDGRSWSTINYTPAWSAKAGAIIGEADQVWMSNSGNVLWSYSLLGFVQVSTNGGRTWSLIEVNGKKMNSDTYGGWPIEFDPVGSSGAYFVTKTGQILQTRTGTNFTPVELLRHTPEHK
jgi:photosystem II stability/assembly factor-like uncharacterized protein